MSRPRALLRGLWSAWQWHREAARSFSYPYMPVLERMAYTLDAIARSVGPAEVPAVDLDRWVREWHPRPKEQPSSKDGCPPQCPCQVTFGGDEE